MTVSHPYKSAPKHAFWSRAIAADWDAKELVRIASSDRPLIREQDKVVSAGSCFASNIVPYLEKAGFTYLRTEVTHPAFSAVPAENLGYANFSAAYGNIYTARQLLQLLKRCLNMFTPVEDRWRVGDEIVDALRPGLRYRARSDREFEVLTAQHLRRTREAFEKADVFVFTLGLTEGWVSQRDGTVFSACPGTVAGSFDPELHAFHNFSVFEIAADLDEFVRLLYRINPKVRLILTVSPVPLVATATGGHVLAATTYSKSVLRVAAREVTKLHPEVTYFPSYEIVTGPQAPKSFFEADRRNVSQEGIDAVMAALLANCEVDQPSAAAPVIAMERSAAANATAVLGLSHSLVAAAGDAGITDTADPGTDHRRNGAFATPQTPRPEEINRDNAEAAMALSQSIAQAVCEEAMADPSSAPVNVAGTGPGLRKLFIKPAGPLN